MNSSICMYFTFFNLGQNSFYVGTTYRMNNIRKASYQSYSSPETHRCSGSRRTEKNPDCISSHLGFTMKLKLELIIFCVSASAGYIPTFFTRQGKDGTQSIVTISFDMRNDSFRLP